MLNARSQSADLKHIFLLLIASSTVPASMIPQRYTYVKTLGTGTFGSVVQAKDEKTGELVAVKKLKRSHCGKYVESELFMHRQLQHPHVIRLREVFLTSNHINIVMDYGNGGSLFDYVNKRKALSEECARWFFQQLIIGVDYCHRKGVSHRDIKLENVLLEEHPKAVLPTVKICDFGYNKPMAAVPRTAVGTLRYMAPEVLGNYTTNNATPYDAEKTDVWSCGVVLYTLVHGQYPFNISESNIAIGYKQMLKQDFKLRPDLSPGIKGLLLNMLQPDPAKRISIAEIMRDKWFETSLPVGALTMNDYYLQQQQQQQQQQCQQSEEDLLQLLQTVYNTSGVARTPTPPPKIPSPAAAAAPAASAVVSCPASGVAAAVKSAAGMLKQMAPLSVVM